MNITKGTFSTPNGRLTSTKSYFTLSQSGIPDDLKKKKDCPQLTDWRRWRIQVHWLSTSSFTSPLALDLVVGRAFGPHFHLFWLRQTWLVFCVYLSSSHRGRREHWLLEPWETLGLCSQQPHGLHKTWLILRHWLELSLSLKSQTGHHPSTYSKPTPINRSPAALFLICISMAEWICWLPFSLPLQVLCTGAGAGEYLTPSRSRAVCCRPLVVIMLH